MLEPLLEGHHPKPHPDFCIQRRDGFSYLEPCPRGVVQLLSRVRVFATPWTAAHQASLSFTISPSFLKLMSIELVMSSNHLILCSPLLLLPSIFPSLRVFSNESDTNELHTPSGYGAHCPAPERTQGLSWLRMQTKPGPCAR